MVLRADSEINGGIDEPYVSCSGLSSRNVCLNLVVRVTLGFVSVSTSNRTWDLTKFDLYWSMEICLV